MNLPLPAHLRKFTRCRAAAVVRGLGLVLLLAGLSNTASAQPGRPKHYFHNSMSPPGTVGQHQLQRYPSLRGYMQPVEVQGPEGSLISVAMEGTFSPAERGALKAGLFVGQIYRFRVGNIPDREGSEVFPSVELINRLYPPPGEELRFPVPIQLTLEELHAALAGRLVTRVVYLENPETALPALEEEGRQRYYDVGVQEDPLRVADRLGRPMAILRMGSRVPEPDPLSGRFSFHCPPVTLFPRGEAEMFEPSPVGNSPSALGLESDPRGGRYQRLPVGPSGRPQRGIPALLPAAQENSPGHLPRLPGALPANPRTALPPIIATPLTDPPRR